MKRWSRSRRDARAGGRARSLTRAALLTLGLLGAGWLGGAEARTVKITSADTLELRQVDGQEIVIISGERVELRIDDDLVIAKRVEFNRTRRTLTLVGAASYYSAKDNQTLKGDDLVINLGDEQVTGQDVLISDADLEIRGQEVERIPGQLKATGGYFTTCAKCGRTPNDFAFRAARLIVYPGDRLVAYSAQLLLADRPVLFLPVVVLPLNDPERQPRLEIDSGAPDGYSVLADLPFSVGSSTLGTTLIRYYQNRNPSLGGGVALRSYSPLPFIDRLNLYYLANPKPFLNGAAQVGYDQDYNFSVKGRIPLVTALRDLDYNLLVTRSDIGRTGSDPELGVTRAEFHALADYPLFTGEFNYVNRFGPEPTTGLAAPLKLPEVVVNPKPYTNGPFSADVKFTAGNYTAASNPLSRSAVAQGVNITTSRLEEQHSLSYSAQPWRNADLALSNTFTGHYYGTGARTVQLNLSAQLTQRFGVNNANSLTASAGYTRNEGTSPFAFDAIPGRLLSAPLALTLSTVPASGVNFGVSLRRDLFLPPEQQPDAAFNLSVNRLPLNLSANLAYQPFTQELSSFTYNATLGDPNSGTLTFVPATADQPATATTPAVPGRPAYYRRSSAWSVPNLTLSASGGYYRTSGYQPFTVRATVTGDVRTNSLSVYALHDIQKPQLDEVGLSANLATSYDTVLNPVTLSASERLLVPTAQLIGTATLTWRNQLVLGTNHSLLLYHDATRPDSGTLNFSVGSVAGSENNWQLTYGGPYDLMRGGFTRPTLVGSVSFTRPGQRLALSATTNIPGLDQQRLELVRADLDSNWQFGTRAALSGRVQYTRDRSGIYPDDKATDRLTLSPVQLSVGLGRAGQRPAAYLTGSLQQTFTWQDGVLQNPAPLTPVIGLTIDRCCWALQAQADLGLKRYRIAIGLPGQSFYPLFDVTGSGLDVPLLPLK